MVREKKRKRKKAKGGEPRSRSRSGETAVTLSRRTCWLVTGAVVLWVALLVSYSAWQGRPKASTVSEVLIQGKVKGLPEAPLTMLIFSDFQCGHCANFALTTARELEEEYVNTGKLRMEFKHVIVGGLASLSAAVATECAAEQNRFWDYHDLLYERLGASLDTDHLKQYAVELGLDQAAFGECLDAGKQRERVLQNTLEGRDLGITATPSFLIGDETGDEILSGDLPVSSFREVIEAALTKNMSEIGS